MGKKFERYVRYAGLFSALFCAAAFSGCSDDQPAARISGSVVQGAVVGATVFADHLTGTEANHKMDADEAATSTTTDATGHFTLPVNPAYDYVIVSVGGTDSLTNKPAMQMMAPAGAQNISPLTTLVALAPPAQQEQVKQAIQSLGGAYDANVATGLTPATALLLESINTTVASLTNVLNTNGNTLSTSAVNSIQQQVMTQVADSIRTQTATQLTTPATLTTTLTTAVTNAITSIDAANTNITVTTSAATLANAIVAPSVAAVATAVSPTGTFSTSPAASAPENTIISVADVSALVTSVTNTVTTTQTQVTVTAPPNSPPTISGAPSISVVAGTAYSFTPTASDPNAGDVLTFSIVNKPAWATFNTATGALTGIPATTDVGTTTGIVISVTDGIGSPVALSAFSLTVTAVTGTTGTTGGAK